MTWCHTTVSPCDTRFCMFSHALTPHIQFLTPGPRRVRSFLNSPTVDSAKERICNARFTPGAEELKRRAEPRKARRRRFWNPCRTHFLGLEKRTCPGKRGRLVTLYKWSNMHPTLTVSPCDTHPTESHAKVFLKVGSSDVTCLFNLTVLKLCCVVDYLLLTGICLQGNNLIIQ